MQKYIYDEKNGLYYTLAKDGMYYPNLALSESSEYQIGKYGRMHLRYLQAHRKAMYSKLLMSGKLNQHLHDIDAKAQEQIDEIVASMAKANGTDENLKATDQMEWVGRMNNYRACAEEIVLREIIYA